MTNANFWESVAKIIDNGFIQKDLLKLYNYAQLFSTRHLIYKRFSPVEQHGCSAGGETHVIATLLAAAEVRTDSFYKESIKDFKRECQHAAKQESIIENWSKATGCWIDNTDVFLENQLGEQIAEGGEAHVYDHGPTLIKSIGLDYFIQPILALDRISLHNALFPETRLTVLGFGRDSNGLFKIIVEQPFIEGEHVTDDEIEEFMLKMGFELKNKRNWTYATPLIYLSDMHDENIIRSASGTIFVIDCDIRINTPELHEGGIRELTTDVSFIIGHHTKKAPEQ